MILVVLSGAGAPVRGVLIADSISVSGDSISRAFNANTSLCNYGDNVSRNWASGDNHGSNFCSTGSDGTFSHAERLECFKSGNVTSFNNARSGADMLSDFFDQASTIRANLSAAPAPRYVPVLLGHNDACTSTLSKTGNSCGGDLDPNNYCRTTNAAFEREFRRGMDQLIQIPDARIGVLATVRVSELCNFTGKNGCGLTLGLNCSVIWNLAGLLEDVFGSGGICASLTSDCSDQRRIDMYNTLVGYNEILERVTNEYADIPPGGQSASGAVKASGVEIRFGAGSFYYKLQSAELSCCDCFHPSDLGQSRMAQFGWDGLQCSPSSPCCATTGNPLTDARCDAVDTTSFYPGGFWAGGVVCGNGILDPGEQCDDGNTQNGDCCSTTCQFDPPTTPCTVDDGNVCTDEVCDAAGHCTHWPNLAACDDGLFCNGTDRCLSGGCTEHAGDPCLEGPECAATCDEATDRCADPAGTPCLDDGNPCTEDACDGAGACGHPDRIGSCDDGQFCNGADTCAGGACSVHTGDPCAGGPECADNCNEGADTCVDPVGTPCTGDGNVCTNDQCDGAGTCGHPNNTLSCDDDNACTTDDRCSGGACIGGPPLVCAPCQTCDAMLGCTGALCTATLTATPTATVTATGTPTLTATPTPSATPTATAAPPPTLTPTATPLCAPLPRTTCRSAGFALLALKNRPDDTTDRLTWKWSRGQATAREEFGDPTGETDYALCLYDAGGPVLGAVVPGGSMWRAIGSKGFAYSDLSASAAGVQKIVLKGSDEDRARALVKGRGSTLPDPTPGSLTAPVVAQLVNSETPVCWEARFEAGDVIENDPREFKAKARN